MSGSDPSSWKDVLKKSNAEDWFMKVHALLECEDLDEFINPEFDLPVFTEATYESTMMRMKKAREIIIVRLTAIDHERIIGGTTQAKDLWAGLKGWALQLNVAELSVVSKSFQSLEMHSGERMHDYVTRAMKLAKLSRHSDSPQSERNEIVHIVRGLPDALYATEKKIIFMFGYPKDFSKLKEKLSWRWRLRCWYPAGGLSRICRPRWAEVRWLLYLRRKPFRS